MEVNRSSELLEKSDGTECIENNFSSTWFSLNIAFDLDGVLFPIEDFQLNAGKKFFGSESIVNENGYGIKEIFGCSKEKEALFWILNTLKFNRKVIVLDGVRKSIEMLKEKGHRVYILSARAMADKINLPGRIMRNLIKKALKRNFVDPDGIIFVNVKNAVEEKKSAIVKYNIHALIDDYKDVLKAVCNTTKTFGVRTRNNEHESFDNVEMAESYEELFIRLTDWTNRVVPKWSPLAYKDLENLSLDEKEKYFDRLQSEMSDCTDRYKFEMDHIGCEKVLKKIQSLFNAVYRPSMLHSEKFPQSGGVILACNHLHSYDPLLIMQNSKQPFHLLAKEELRDNPKWNKLFTSIGSVFVDNGNRISREKAKWDLVKILLADGTVMMFPEGTRNRTEEQLLPFHMGTINIAMYSGCPIIPLAINADYRLFKNRLICSVGNPIIVKRTDDAVEMNSLLKEKILELLGEVHDFQGCKGRWSKMKCNR